jgi:hypothetical protein
MKISQIKTEWKIIPLKEIVRNLEAWRGGTQLLFQLLGRQRQEDHKFKPSHVKLGRPYRKKKIKTHGWGCEPSSRAP